MNQARWRDEGREVVSSSILSWTFSTEISTDVQLEIQIAICVKFLNSRCSLGTRNYSSNHQFLSNQWTDRKFDRSPNLIQQFEQSPLFLFLLLAVFLLFSKVKMCKIFITQATVVVRTLHFTLLVSHVHPLSVFSVPIRRSVRFRGLKL